LKAKRRYSVSNNLIRIGTIFITGISASGKSTLGKRLKENLLKTGINNVKFLDGEEIRKQLAKRGKCYGYSTVERNELALEFGHMALEYNRKGMVCIICSICHCKEIRAKMREVIGNVMEVYLDCPVTICAQRDYKGNYAKAFQGLYDNFIGVTEPYQKSDNVELVLQTDKNMVDKCSQTLLEEVLAFLKKGQGKTEQYVERVKNTRDVGI